VPLNAWTLTQKNFGWLNERLSENSRVFGCRNASFPAFSLPFARSYIEKTDFKCHLLPCK
jgi:hypothetical protein